MRISQYASFELVSKRVSAAEIATVLSLEPDEVTLRGSRFPGPPHPGPPRPVPFFHRWKIVCREPGLGVEQQVEAIVTRLAPHTEAIAELARRLGAEEGEGAGAELEIVRKYHHPEGQDRRADSHPELLDPPDLLGWWLSAEVLAFLHTTGAGLSVDEYDYSPDAEDS